MSNVGSIGVFAVPFTLLIELVGNQYKTLSGIFFEIPWALGEISLGLLAMGIRDYRWYQTALSIPCVIMLGVLYFIPESPRWLIQKKRYEEAQMVIKQAANFNNVRIVFVHLRFNNGILGLFIIFYN